MTIPTFTPQRIKDYESCERYYDFLYNDELKVRSNNRALQAEKFHEAVFRVASHYMFRRQSMEDPSLKSLHNRWQKDWYGEMTSKDIAGMSNPISQKSHTSYGTTAAAALERFHKYFKDASGSDIFWINESFVVPITENQWPLEGKVDLVVRKEDPKELFVYKWASSTHGVEYWNYELLSAGLALRNLPKYSDYSIRYFVWLFTGPSIGAREVQVEAKDYHLMTYWIKKMAEDTVMPSRFGLLKKCDVCPFKNPCQKWDITEKETQANE